MHIPLLQADHLDHQLLQGHLLAMAGQLALEYLLHYWSVFFLLSLRAVCLMLEAQDVQ